MKEIGKIIKELEKLKEMHKDKWIITFKVKKLKKKNQKKSE